MIASLTALSNGNSRSLGDAAAAPSVPGTQYRVAPWSIAALFVRTDDRSWPVIELKPKPA
jgi:hypothetical protein